jgi:formate-dependent nitrite reductase membrane component NrfD
MSQQSVTSRFGELSLPDYLMRAAYIAYAVAGIMFLIGLYFDLVNPGETVIPLLAFSSEPTNSGVFVLSIIILILGLISGKISQIIKSYQTSNIDQTQEWTVDVGRDKRR